MQCKPPHENDEKNVGDATKARHSAHTTGIQHYLIRGEAQAAAQRAWQCEAAFDMGVSCAVPPVRGPRTVFCILLPHAKGSHSVRNALVLAQRAGMRPAVRLASRIV